MTKIDVFSGFIGAGKTTLINRIVREAIKHETIAIVENEFGDIGIDGTILEESGINIKEISGGCICCTLFGNFVNSIVQLITEYRPERIIVEPTGLGKLSDVINALLSDQSLKVERPSKSSFFTKGWLQNKHTAANHEYLNTVEKFGKEQADMLTKIMYSAYEHFTLVNTGAYDMKEAYDLLTPLASVIPIEINEIPGKCGVLKKMLQLDLDDNFIFIAPGEKVQEKDFM